MTIEQATEILNQALASINTTRQNHLAFQKALEVLVSEAKKCKTNG